MSAEICYVDNKGLFDIAAHVCHSLIVIHRGWFSNILITWANQDITKGHHMEAVRDMLGTMLTHNPSREEFDVLMQTQVRARNALVIPSVTLPPLQPPGLVHVEGVCSGEIGAIDPTVPSSDDAGIINRNSDVVEPQMQSMVKALSDHVDAGYPTPELVATTPKQRKKLIAFVENNLGFGKLTLDTDMLLTIITKKFSC